MKNIDINNSYYKHNPEYFLELFELYQQTKGHGLSIRLNHSKKHLKSWIEFELPILKDNIYSLTTKCYWILNGLSDFPKCISCGKSDNYRLKNVSLNDGYNTSCCVECGRKQQRIAIKSKFKNMSKEQIQQIVEKRKTTCMKKYGVENPQQYKQISQKSRATRLEKNNGKYFSEESISKMIDVKRQKYGSANNYEKIKRTCNSRYGVDNVSQLQTTKEKVKLTCQKKYGVDCPAKSADVQKKMKASCLKKYGVDNVFKLKSTHDKAAYIAKLNSYNNYILNNPFDTPMFTFQQYIERKSDAELLQFKCKKCNKTFYSRHEDGDHKHCEYCYPSLISQFTSQEEKDLQNFIICDCKQKAVLKNSKRIISPYELDICIPEKKLAFEFDGLYWHNDDNKKDKNYHLNKTNLCELKGYQLIHIFENEWMYKNQIVKSRIKNLLGIYDQIIFARKCVVKEVDAKTSLQFQTDNHIQGPVNSKVNLGLYYNEELISLMTFGKCRFDKKHEWELLRFCNKLGYHVPGGASKLLKYFERIYQPKSLVSYADRRWSQGKLYEALGFKLDHVSGPNYWYIQGNILHSRIKFQKHKLKGQLNDYDDTLTEVENMKANGYSRIFDCGNLVYIKSY